MAGSRGRLACRTACMHPITLLSLSKPSDSSRLASRNRTALSGPTEDGQRRRARKSSDLSKQLRQWDVHRAFHMVLGPFLGRSNIQGDRTLGTFHRSKEVPGSYLRNLERLVQIIGGDKPTTSSNPIRASSSRARAASVSYSTTSRMRGWLFRCSSCRRHGHRRKVRTGADPKLSHPVVSLR